MSFLSYWASIACKGGLTLAGIIGFAAFASSPAGAENASIQGAATRATPGGYSSSTAGQMIAPDSTYFKGPLEITPTFTTPVGGGTSIPTSLRVSAVNGVQPGGAGYYDPQTLSAMLTSPALMSDPQLKEQAYAALDAAYPNWGGVGQGLGMYLRTDSYWGNINLNLVLQWNPWLLPAIISRVSPPDIKKTVITKLNTIDINTQQGRDAYSAIVKAASGANGLE
ncbi:MAG: hypothetical protein KME43_14015 [Myxacorys chilensis ATA2-1-KO14]|jgi:hypothetical protein|nr:hypothetical protein [Myxacorys chilensis ATA2-1-KO14]